MTWIDRPRRTTLLVAVTALVMQIAVLPVRRPLILPDEAGFLLNARRLATGSAPSGLDYFPGYSLLLTPVAGVTSDLMTVTRLVQIVNGGLVVAAALAATKLARLLQPQLSEPAVAAIGILAAAYPAYRLFAAFALAENLLVPWTVLLCILFARCLQRPDLSSAALFGLCAGWSLSIHARALGLTVAAVAAGVLWLRGRQLGAMLAGMTAGAGAAIALVAYTLDTSVDSGAARNSPGALLSDAASLRGVVDVASSALGQTLYLLVASIGLLGLGTWWFLDQIRAHGWPAEGAHSRHGDDRVRAGVSTLALFMMTASLGISSMFLAGRVGDFAIYGRYGEGVALPFLVAGLAYVSAATGEAMRRALPIALAIPASASLLYAVRGPEAFQGRRLLLNIAGVFPVVDALDEIRLSAIAGLGVGAIVVIGGAFWWHRPVGVALAAAGCLLTSTFSIERSAEAIEVLEQQDDLVAVIAQVGATVDCVALDIWQLPDRWHQENYRLTLDDQEFRYWSSAAAAPPCSDLIVSRRSDLDERYPGAAVVAVEPFGQQALWVLPGATMSAAEQSGFESIADPLDPFADQQAVLDLTVPSSIALDETVEMTVEVDNVGPAGFFPEQSFGEVVGTVNIGLEFRSTDAPGVRRHEPVRLRLPAALAPGSTVTLSATLRPIDIDPELRPGTHVLVASIVQEGIGWTDLATAMQVEIRP